MMYLPFVVLAFLGAFGDAMKPHKLCYEEYPELSGLLCYKSCKRGYRGAGPVCWADCPPGTKDIGALCVKNTYTRTAGKPVSYCPPDRNKEGLLCFKKCKRGYSGSLLNCWENCPSGYTNFPISCTKGWHTFFKKKYWRGGGHGLWCRPDEQQNGALCYPKCKSGYYGIAFVCWAKCSGETTDTGTQCQKKSYTRGVGKPVNCFNIPSKKTIPNWENLVKILDKVDGSFDELKKVGCNLLYTQISPFIAILEGLNGCLRSDTWTTISVSFTAELAALATTSTEGGIAVDVQAKKGMCFWGYCGGFKTDISVGASLVIGYWRRLSDIPGEAYSFEIGVDIPGTELGITCGLTWNPDKEIIGIQFAIGIGFGVSPVEIGWGKCSTPEEDTIPVTIIK